MLASLADDVNWRVRHATLLLLPTLAAMMPVSRFSATFVALPLGAFEQRATDPCALIRLDWVRTCKAIATLPEYAAAWLSDAVLPVLRARHAETRNYQRRAVLLDGLATLAPYCSAEMLEELVPLALSMVTDKVPNLRLQLAASLQQAAPHFGVVVITTQVLPALAELEADEDIDVLGAAREAIEACLALTTARRRA